MCMLEASPNIVCAANELDVFCCRRRDGVGAEFAMRLNLQDPTKSAARFGLGQQSLVRTMDRMLGVAWPSFLEM